MTTDIAGRTKTLVTALVTPVRHRRSSVPTVGVFHHVGDVTTMMTAETTVMNSTVITRRVVMASSRVVTSAALTSLQ